MNEIRPIRDGEAEAFLELLCEVFELDYSRAQGIFFSEPMFDLQRKWALFDRGQMISILTTVPLEFGWGRAIGIAGVATKGSRRRQGLAGILLNYVLAQSEKIGEDAAFLFAKQTTVYERSGFSLVDKVIRAPIRALGDISDHEPLPIEEVMKLYEHWSYANDNRLRRDERRWNYWKWNFKVCTPFLGGYVCPEGSLVRECLTDGLEHSWPVPKGTHWLGLSSMAVNMGVPIGAPQTELLLMARNAPALPQMFMTDQF